MLRYNPKEPYDASEHLPYDEPNLHPEGLENYLAVGGSLSLPIVIPELTSFYQTRISHMLAVKKGMFENNNGQWSVADG